MFRIKDRYVRRMTDFRAVFAEIFTRHFGDGEDMIETIIPGYAQAAQNNPGDFERLDFIRQA